MLSYISLNKFESSLLIQDNHINFNLNKLIPPQFPEQQIISATVKITFSSKTISFLAKAINTIPWKHLQAPIWWIIFLHTNRLLVHGFPIKFLIQTFPIKDQRNSITSIGFNITEKTNVQWRYFPPFWINENLQNHHTRDSN